VFIATVNDDHFLADKSGNTRFWVLPVASLKHEHTVDMQQVWAEIFSLWAMGEGEAHWLSPDEMKLVNDSASDFEEGDPVQESLARIFAWDEVKADPDLITWDRITVSQALLRAGYERPNAAMWKLGANALKRLGAKGYKRTNRGGSWLVPVLLNG
jgi:putative DNA primase/helicase